MTNSNVAEEIIDFVTTAFNEPWQCQYPYHNLEHTKRVVQYSTEIANFYALDETDRFIVMTAAWFHDIGHLYGDIHGHEERGAKIMADHLAQLPKELITDISSCIIATKGSYTPQTLNEKILCDADTYHLGTPLFRETDPLVKMELETRTGKKFFDWQTKSLHFLQKHVYYTTYCQDRLNTGLQENIRWLENILNTSASI